MSSETSAVNAAYIEARMKQFKLVDIALSIKSISIIGLSNSFAA